MNEQTPYVHIAGNSGEALFSSRMELTAGILAHLNTDLQSRIAVLFRYTPSPTLQEIFGLEDTLNEKGEKFIAPPSGFINFMIVHFVEGWNARVQSCENAIAPLDVKAVFRKWEEGGRDPRILADSRLSPSPENFIRMLQMEPEILGDSTKKNYLELDISDWRAISMLIFTDGWNAAKQKIDKSIVNN